MTVLCYKDLYAWQKSMLLVKEVYQLTKKLPKEETYGLISQMRRAAVSIPSNIAEGHERNHTKEYINFLSIARGSKAELETQVLLCRDLEYINDADIRLTLNLSDETGRLISSYINKLKINLTPDPSPLIPDV